LMRRHRVTTCSHARRRCWFWQLVPRWPIGCQGWVRQLF